MSEYNSSSLSLQDEKSTSGITVNATACPPENVGHCTKFNLSFLPRCVLFFPCRETKAQSLAAQLLTAGKDIYLWHGNGTRSGQILEGNWSSANATGPDSWSVPIPCVGAGTVTRAGVVCSTRCPARAPLSDASVSHGFGCLIRHWEKQMLLSLYKIKKPTDRSPMRQTFSGEVPLLELYFTMVYEFCIEFLFCMKSLFWKWSKWTKAKTGSLWLLLFLLMQC